MLYSLLTIIFHNKVLEITDKLWVHGISEGGYGKVPANCIATVDRDFVFPSAAQHETLFVVSAEFAPAQEGDLGLLKGQI